MRLLLAVLWFVVQQDGCPCVHAQPATGVDITRVATALELRAAGLAGAPHILITQHLDLRQLRAADGSPDLTSVQLSTTQSITGNCEEDPALRRFAPRNIKPGQCAILLDSAKAFDLHQSPNGTSARLLWLSHIWLLYSTTFIESTGTVLALSTDVPLYLTDVIIQGNGSPEALGLYVTGFPGGVVASGLHMVDIPADVSRAYMIDSRFDTTLSDSFDGFVDGAAIRVAIGPLALERCSFNTSAGAAAGLAVINADSVTYDVEVYRDAIVLAAKGSVSALPRPLDELPAGQLLSFQDEAFVLLEAQVRKAVPGLPTLSLSAPVTPSSEPPASSNSVRPEGAGTNDAPQPSPSSTNNSTNAGLIAGVVAGVVVAVGGAIGGVFVWHRTRRRTRSSRNGPGTASPMPPSASQGATSSRRTDGEADSPTHPLEVEPAVSESAYPDQEDAVAKTMATEADASRGVLATRPPSNAATHGNNTMSLSARQPTNVLITMTNSTRSSGTPAGLFNTARSPSSGQVHSTARSTTLLPARRTHADPVSGLPAVEALEDALDAMHKQQQLLLERYEVLNAAHRRGGGQGLVQFVKDTLKYGEDAVVKYFRDRVAFTREAELYNMPEVREMMAAVVELQGNEDGALRAPNGFVWPPFIVLEKGRSLNEWALLNNPDYITSLQVLVQIVERLRALHACNLVHRDIKPANIMWRTHYGQWTLIDFGCASANGLEEYIACSVPYAPPEVAQALKDKQTKMRVHTSVDIWSLGVVIYELLVGERAFPGRSADTILDALTSPKPFPWEPGSARADSMQKLGIVRRVVKLCLSRDPAERPSAETLLGYMDNMFRSAVSLTQSQSSEAVTPGQTLSPSLELPDETT